MIKRTYIFFYFYRKKNGWFYSKILTHTLTSNDRTYVDDTINQGDFIAGVLIEKEGKDIYDFHQYVGKQK